MKLSATKTMIKADKPTDPTPTIADIFFDILPPKIARIAKLTNGMTGTSQISCSTSASHPVRDIGIKSLEPVIKLQNERQTHGHFRSRHNQNEDKHDLTVGLVPL